MKERNISKEEVETCLEAPDISYPSHEDDDCINYVRNLPTGRKIRVVVNEKRSPQRIVVSAMEIEGE